MKAKENKTNERVIVIDKILSKGIHNKGAEIAIEVIDENQNKNFLVFNTYEFLSWFSNKDIKFLKENVQKHIKNM